MPDLSPVAFNRFALDSLHFEEKMGSNSQWPSHVSRIYEKLNVFPQDFPKLRQVDHNPVSSALFNPNPNTPPSSCLTTHDSSSIPHELDSQNPNTPCSILTSHYANTPPSSSCLLNHSSTSSTASSCSEILSVLNNQSLNNSVATYLPSINYSSTSSYKISDGVWNGGEIHVQQAMDLDQKPSHLTEVNLDEPIEPLVLSLPNLMINPDYVLRHSSECLSCQPWFQPSQFEQQQKTGMPDSNFPYYGSSIIGSFFTNAPVMEIGVQECSFDTPTQRDQINKLPEQGIVVKNVERKEKRMLKNRESAARSRAKKQAHVNCLEHKSWRLKKDNDLLNKEQVFLQSIPRPKLQLRRTSSFETIQTKIHL